MIVKTSKKREVVDVTDAVQTELQRLGAEQGICNVFVQHTTAAITTADLDPGGTDEDYLDAFEKLVPKLAYRHPHDPEHMPDHILSSLIGTSLTVPVHNGKLALGAWQRVVLIELDGPRDRNLAIIFSSTAS